MAGDLQNNNPNPCRLSPDGFFGSKFATVIVTGDAENQVHMEGYQVSNQCMALVRDDCLVPTKDAPELGYVKESSNEQFVPDVFFKEKDEYGNEVTQLARPLPIEYLLVDVPVSTPMDPQFTFSARDGVQPFPVENRLIDGHIQDFNALSTYLQQFTPSRFLEAVSDFHFLVYIATMETLPLKEYLSPLLDAVKSKDEGLAHEWGQSEQWATVEQLIAANANSPVTSQMLRPSSGAGAMWTCSRCTYNNEPDRTMCEICSQAK
jgi:nuclear protein localization family protein 4